MLNALAPSVPPPIEWKTILTMSPYSDRDAIVVRIRGYGDEATTAYVGSAMLGPNANVCAEPDRNTLISPFISVNGPVCAESSYRSPGRVIVSGIVWNVPVDGIPEKRPIVRRYVEMAEP